jgi:hypothetical protein
VTLELTRFSTLLLGLENDSFDRVRAERLLYEDEYNRRLEPLL